MMMRLLSILFLFALVGARGATYCVGPSATGSGTGVDWSNMATMPTGSSFVRDTTYYISDGTYGGITISTPNSGTQLITIKKATPSDHGVSTGWVDTMGDDQAVFTKSTADTILISGCSYLVFDGVTGSSNNTRGFKFTTTAQGDGGIVSINSGGVSSHLLFQNMEIAGVGTVTTNSTNFFYGYTGTVTAQQQDVQFNNIYVHDVFIWIASSFAVDTVIENSFFERAGSDWPDGYSGYWGTPVNYHGVGFTHRTNGYTLRNSVIRDMIGGHNTTYVEPQFLWTNGAVYGNLFYASTTNEATAQAAISLTGADITTNFYVFNNTFHGLAKPGVRCNFSGSQNFLVYNNIWQACRNIVDLSNVNDASYNTTNGVVFVNTNTFDFHLTTSLVGTNLGSTYSPDMYGVTRGADGIYDQGAMEFVYPVSTNTPIILKNKVKLKGNVKLKK